MTTGRAWPVAMQVGAGKGWVLKSSPLFERSKDH
jgi:hypothetical protein